MTSRSKSQENLYKAKLTAPSESRCRRNSSSIAPKSEEHTVAEISMKDFLDFLRISYQVNDVVEGDKSNIKDKVNFDWKSLTNNALIRGLKITESSVEGKISTVTSNPSEKCPVNIIKDIDIRETSNELSNEELNKSSSQILEDKKLEINGLMESQTLEQNVLESVINKKNDKDKTDIFKTPKDNDNAENSAEINELNIQEERVTIDKLLKKKLNEVLQEGILDSVLPYVLPKQEQVGHLQAPAKKLLLLHDSKKNSSGCSDKNDKNTCGNTVKEKKDARRKSLSSNDCNKMNKLEKKDVEVVIHVCDEIKNLKRDFRCLQKLLVSEMGYFAEVTNGQKLEDMDISVHCDIAIFDWLMKWVQRDVSFEETWPRLDPVIVVPVLLSSAFLHMDTLQDHCLKYCKSNINEILRDSSNLSCINDSILTRLANMFSNREVENLRDKKDKIQSRLYCKLISALTDPQPQPQRGHYSTVATMYRCSKCSKLILRNISSSILCVPSCMILDRNGFVISTHVRDPNWNLTEYVKNLKSDLKVWKKVYWRLWSDCHLLFCHTCSSYFPVHQMFWCRYHSESAQFFAKENQKSISFPVGRHPCCGERAYRFELLKNELGCQYREHTTELKTTSETEIFRIWNDFRDLIKADPPSLVASERVRHYVRSKEDGTEKKSPVKESFWWEGLQLIPVRPKFGLLASAWDKIMKKEEIKTPKPDSRDSHSPLAKKSNATSHATGYELSSASDSSDQQSTASDAGDSEDSSSGTMRTTSKIKNLTMSTQSAGAARLPRLRKEKKKKLKKMLHSKSNRKNEGCQFWLPKLSTRCNQDNQREFEERAFKQIEAVLMKKMSGDSSSSTSRSNNQSAPPGGVYIKLEQEWREAHCNMHGCPASSVKAKTSASGHGSSFNSINFYSGRTRTKSHRL